MQLPRARDSRQVKGIRDGRALRIHSSRLLKRAAHEIRHHMKRDEVEHDRADHFQHAVARPQKSSDASPYRASRSRCEECEGDPQRRTAAARSDA